MTRSAAAQMTRRNLLQKGAVLASGGLALPGLLMETGRAQENPSAIGEQRWMIGNELIERTITFSAAHGLATAQLVDLGTKASYILPGPSGRPLANEFSLQCGGRTVNGSGANFQFLGADHDSLPHGKALTIRLRQTALDLDIAVTYRVYDGHPAIRKSLTLTNTGKDPVRISHLSIEALGLSLGPENELVLDALYGSSPREILYTGRSEDAALLVTNSRTGQGMAVISEVPGYMKRTEIVGWYDPDRVRVAAMYDTDLMPFERTVGPGESFTTAAVSLVSYRRDDGFRDPRWVLPSYTSDVLMRRGNAEGPPWIYNTWVPFRRTIHHDLVMQLIDAASDMGIEIFTLDDGWQKEYGENAVDLASFPQGLKPIQQVLESKGMRLGVWIPLAAIGKTTAEYRNHPEWATRDLQGNEKTTGTAAGEKVVMCLASPYRNVAAQRISEAIERFHLAYVKLDITTIFNAYGEAPGCWAKDHDHATWAESLNRIYEGIAYVTRQVYAKHPDVLIDITFEVWGQKHLIDAGLLAAGDLDWLSNVDDTQPHSAGPIQARQLLYTRAASMPVESMLIGNIQAELPSKEESFATAIGSAPLLLGDLRRLSESDRQWYREKTSWFRSFRRRTKISESFFPLGSWKQTSSAKWDGYARLDRTGSGVIALFRNHAPDVSALARLPLIPPGSYRLRSVMSGADLGQVTQSDWARGVPITFPSTATVEVLEMTRA